MSSVTVTKEEVNLKMLPMQELKIYIEEKLQEDMGISTELENMTDSDLNLKLSQGPLYKSHLHLYRESHKPLIVNMEIDFNYYNARKEAFKENQKRQKQSSNQGGSGLSSMFRLYWMYWLFGGILVGGFFIITQILDEFIENLTPGMTDQDRGLLLAGLAIIFFITWVVVIPQLARSRKRYNETKDKEVIQYVKKVIGNLDKELTGDKVKCWNCFKDIDYNDKVCPFCGKNQK